MTTATPKTTGARAPRVGFHAPIAGGLQNALLKARALGADTVQIFSRNPRGWKARPLDTEEVENFKHLREIAARCPGLHLGVCLDTAHAFTAGYDIRSREGLAAALDSLDANVGLANVLAVHFNDSRADYNSRVDRHWHVGLGHIGAEALRRVAREPRLSHAAFLLETPQDELVDGAS